MGVLQLDLANEAYKGDESVPAQANCRQRIQPGNRTIVETTRKGRIRSYAPDHMVSNHNENILNHDLGFER